MVTRHAADLQPVGTCCYPALAPSLRFAPSSAPSDDSRTHGRSPELAQCSRLQSCRAGMRRVGREVVHAQSASAGNHALWSGWRNGHRTALIRLSGCFHRVLPAGCPYLVFLEMVTVLSGDRVLWSSPPSSLFGLLGISSRTSCRVSRSFSLIPAFGLNTPRWRGSSSGTSGSRCAPTIWIFLLDLGGNTGVYMRPLV